ncbi:MAG TPA: hypothetical protein ENO19_06850 [Halothiobacillaceae bacterium]|nr:hypothetical protein [Halothiobacillaceae bacterium]
MVHTFDPCTHRVACGVLGFIMGVAAAATWAAPVTPTPQERLFQIRVCDRDTGRGVPLIRLTTTNHITHVTDSAGVIAFHEPGLMDREVFFDVSGHGYTYPKDGFGFRGVRLRTTPGASATIHVDRVNIAERLYRLTGQGIYRDSVLLGLETPIAEPVLNGQVMGQDSVQNCWYRGRLYWFWGDTGRPSYPLGHFAMAGAVSQLPHQGGLDPSVGVDLEYFTDADGFSRRMAPLDEPGMVWLDGLFTVPAPDGAERMLATYARMKSLNEATERGLMVFDDDKQQFIRQVRGDGHWLLYPASGHPFSVRQEDDRYWYFATPFPLAVRMRVRAAWEAAIDPGAYEILTALSAPNDVQSEGATGGEMRPRWVASRELIKQWNGDREGLMKALKDEKDRETHLIDVESGSAVVPHNGSVFWNAHRRRWIMIAVQQGGDTSFLGEVWYAEADTPVGPWAYGRKIVTHDHYTFYNPKHHPYFDQQGGRIVYFEGTYSHTFSQAKSPTPRYDYNQIMYRLDLDDERLTLPSPVYESGSPDQGFRYLTGAQWRDQGEVTPIRVAFYAVGPERDVEGLIPIYAKWEGVSTTLTARKEANATGAFLLAQPADETIQDDDPLRARLFEYIHRDTGARRYAVDSLDPKVWNRKAPVCTVWKKPSTPTLMDWTAKPCNTTD